MVICFECSKEAKAALDTLLATGGYKDYSEVLAVALANQLLLHSKIRESEPRSISIEKGSSAQDLIAPVAAPKSAPSRAVSLALAPELDLSRYGVPSLLSALPAYRGNKSKGAMAPYHLPETRAGGQFPFANWIFGQYNRLLPVKVTCRALARLISNSDGVEIDKAGRTIADAANDLGLHLKMLDRRHQRSRDEMLSTAFPSSAEPEKGKLRYASQFVASLNKAGVLSGLPADLQFLGLVRDHNVSLTEAGWVFAEMTNPVLDGTEDNPSTRFTAQEREFLLSHIQTRVPTECFAYKSILHAISEGQNTPDLLTQALKRLEAPEGKISAPFYATQRSGAISRMSDLELISRDRDGIRVRYAITPAGKEFLSRVK